MPNATFKLYLIIKGINLQFNDDEDLSLGLWCLMPLSTIFSYIVAVSFIG
jgi:hypothetical protein